MPPLTTSTFSASFAAYVNEGNNFYGLTLKLTQDLDLSGVTDRTPIGNSSKKYFSGSLDGDGNAIRNLTVDMDADKLGLFGTSTAALSKISRSKIFPLLISATTFLLQPAR